MNKNCRFNRTFNRKTRLYKVSFSSLTKDESNLLLSVFRSLTPLGVVYNYQNGITLPCLELRCSVPLLRSVGSSLCVPYSVLSTLFAEVNNTNFPLRDEIVSRSGSPISKISIYGY